MFLIISDDLAWCRNNLQKISKNVVVLDRNEKSIDDLALMSYGAHSIMSLGTFGLWGAMLSEGNVSYPGDKISNKPYWLQESFFKMKDSSLIRIGGI